MKNAFFEFNFTGYDQTKWGPSDFYDNAREQLAAAFKSGKDFDTGWMSCKKEILSPRIYRINGELTVEVSVSDDFDTSGIGRAHGGNPASLEEFFAEIEKLSDEAWEEAREDLRGNASFIGYSIGRRKGGIRENWEFTFLVDCMGFDVPTGDNYHRFGWQEVETEDDYDMEARPDAIPASVAKILERGMYAGKSKVTCKGWVATKWND